MQTRVTSHVKREVAGSNPVISPEADVAQLVERLRTLFDFPLLFKLFKFAAMAQLTDTSYGKTLR